jgi:hypothetical protein
MRIRIMKPRPGYGPRVVVSLGGEETSLTVSEATELHRALVDALLVVAKRHGAIDPRIDEMVDEEEEPVKSALSSETLAEAWMYQGGDGPFLRRR